MAAESPKLSLPWRLFLLGLGVLAVLPYALGAGGASLSVLVVAAIPLYLAAHAVRVLRLIVLLGNESPSLRAVTGAHCISAAAGFLPAKTGEGARILALGKVQGSTWSALRTVWIERTFDAAVIGVLGLVVTPWLGLAWWVSVGFLVTTALMLTILPGNLRLGKRWLIARYTTEWLLRVLPLVDRAATEVERAQRHVQGRVTVLATLTAAIWALEFMAFGCILGPLREDVSLISVLSAGLVSPSSQSAPFHLYQLIVSMTALGLGAFALVLPLAAPRSDP